MNFKIIFVSIACIAVGLLAAMYISDVHVAAPLPEATIVPPSVESFLGQEVMRDGLEQRVPKVEVAAQAETIAETKVASPTLLHNCSGMLQSNFECYETYFSSLVRDQSIAAAFSVLKEEYVKNAYVKSMCHPLTHVIGQAASDKFPNVSSAYVEGDGFCWSGYYHGVLEGVIGRIGETNLAKEMNNICADLGAKRKYSFDHYNCVHGLGHGVMAITNDQLFDSLKMCDELRDGWERQSCWSGVFMENIIIDNKNHFTEYLKPSDPAYPCNAVKDAYKNICYLMQTSYMLKVTGGDFSKVFDLCGQVEEGYQDTCYRSLGRDASGRSVSNVEQTKAWCMLGKDFRQQSHCVIGATKDFVSYFHSDVQANTLCAALDKSLQSICLSTVQEYYARFQ